MKLNQHLQEFNTYAQLIMDKYHPKENTLDPLNQRMNYLEVFAKEIKRFTDTIIRKENDILHHASMDLNTDLKALQQNLIESEKRYIKQYIDKYKPKA